MGATETFHFVKRKGDYAANAMAFGDRIVWVGLQNNDMTDNLAAFLSFFFKTFGDHNILPVIKHYLLFH